MANKSIKVVIEYIVLVILVGLIAYVCVVYYLRAQYRTVGCADCMGDQLVIPDGEIKSRGYTNEEGYFIISKIYKDGKKNGTEKIFREDGSLIEEKVWGNGELVSSKKNTAEESLEERYGRSLQKVNDILKEIRIGETSRGAAEGFFQYTCFLKEGYRTVYYEYPQVLIEVPYDTTGAPWSKKNRVSGAIKVSRGYPVFAAQPPTHLRDPYEGMGTMLEPGWDNN